MLNIDMNNVDGALHIALEGRLNAASTKDLVQQLDPIMEEIQSVDIDLAKLDYISSAGLRILIKLQQHMQQIGGENVRVRNAKGTVRDTLEMAGFAGVINIE